MTDFQV